MASYGHALAGNSDTSIKPGANNLSRGRILALGFCRLPMSKKNGSVGASFRLGRFAFCYYFVKAHYSSIPVPATGCRATGMAAGLLNRREGYKCKLAMNP